MHNRVSPSMVVVVLNQRMLGSFDYSLRVRVLQAERRHKNYPNSAALGLSAVYLCNELRRQAVPGIQRLTSGLSQLRIANCA